MCYLKITSLKAEVWLVSEESRIQNQQEESHVLYTSDATLPYTLPPGYRELCLRGAWGKKDGTAHRRYETDSAGPEQLL